MNNEIFISVIIPLYNKEASILSTIRSVLSQTMPNFEIIIVDDGSTDDSLSVAKSIDDIRLKIYTTKNLGVSHARNYGVAKASYAYVAFLDADDYWYPNHLAVLSQMITRFPTYRWFATAYDIQHTNRLCLPMSSPLMVNGEDWIGVVEDYFSNSLHDNLAWTSAVCMRKEFFDLLGGFDLTLRNNQDTDLWLRAALLSPLVFSTTLSARYIIAGDGHISKRDIMKKTVMDFDHYETYCDTIPSLKRYLDLNRYSVALKYKLAGERGLSAHYSEKIDLNNLSKRQRFILKSPRCLTQALMLLKQFLEVLNLRFRSN